MNNEVAELDRKKDRVIQILNSNNYKHNPFTREDFEKWPLDIQKRWIRAIERMESKPELAKSIATMSDEEKQKRIKLIRGFYSPGQTEKMTDEELWLEYVESILGGH